MNLSELYKTCRKSEVSIIHLIFRFLYYKTKGKTIFLHQRTKIKGIDNIITDKALKIGITYKGFVDARDNTLLNIQGKAYFKGSVEICRGSRLDIGEKGIIEIGNGSRIGPFSIIVIQNRLIIGSNTGISWNCRFLDSDFHKISYEGKKPVSETGITIGNNVWIGNNVSFYKGSSVASGSVVAADSVIKTRFEEENVLIAGNPAKIVRQNISWNRNL
jgi:acetyltransferase-like isoleucine patch superfamily enzyme